MKPQANYYGRKLKHEKIRLVDIKAWFRISILSVLLLIVGCFDTSGDPIPFYENPQTALLIMDMQQDFLHKNGRMPIAAKQITPLIDKTNNAIAEARTQGLPIILIANAFDPSDSIGNWFRNDAAISGTSGAKIDNRLKAENAPVFQKSAPDAFTNKAFETYLQQQQINHLIVLGVFADQCVYWTIKGAKNRNYRVSVLENALGASDSDDLKEAIASFREMDGVELISSVKQIYTGTN